MTHALRQTRLIEQVKLDIKVLQDKFKVSFTNTKAAEMSEVRDLPPVSAQIIWAKQLDRQLSMYLDRVGQVLGTGWEQHVDGRSLKEDGDRFHKMLDPQTLYDEWVQEALSKDLSVTGTVFDVQLERTGGGHLEPIVNFHPTIINLAKEVRTLRTLGFRPPLTIQRSANEAHQLYPFAIAVKSSLKAYQQTVEQLHEEDYFHGVRHLVAGWHATVQERMHQGFTTQWDSSDLQQLTVGFNEAVDMFLERTHEAIEHHAKSCELIDSLTECHFDRGTIGGIMDQVQESLQQLQFDGFSNLATYARHLDARVERRFLSRLPHALRLWVCGLVNHGLSEEEIIASGTLVTEETPPITPTTHEIVIKNQVRSL